MRSTSAWAVAGGCAVILLTGWAVSPKGNSGVPGPYPTSAGGPTPTVVPGGNTSGVSGTFKGAAIATPRGVFQVSVTFKNGVATKVTTVKAGSRDGTSQQINAYSLPRLESLIVSGQTWNVAYISGASYTSYGITNSAKGAFQQAGVK